MVDNGFFMLILKIKCNMVEGVYGLCFYEWVECCEVVFWYE